MKHLPADPTIDTVLGNKVHLSADNLYKFCFHLQQQEKGGRDIGCKLNEHIHFTVRSIILAQHRSEQCQLSDMMSLAERSNFLTVNRNLHMHKKLLDRVHIRGGV